MKFCGNENAKCNINATTHLPRGHLQLTVLETWNLIVTVRGEMKLMQKVRKEETETKPKASGMIIKYYAWSVGAEQKLEVL